MDSESLRQAGIQRLREKQSSVGDLKAFVGLDGFVDEIIHVVDKRDSAESFQRVPTIQSLAERIAGAAGKSANIELVSKTVKLGGNGPIMANALASLGSGVTYLGSLGYPNLHPVFEELAQRAEVFSIAEAAHTDALEFADGKLMFGKMTPLNEVNWEVMKERFGQEKLQSYLAGSDLVAFVNWTMIPYMSDLWDSILCEICPNLSQPESEQAWMFFDLADPEKRHVKDIQRALELIEKFQKHFRVILGLNEKETHAIAEALGLPHPNQDSEGIGELAADIHRVIKVDTIVAHPVTCAFGTHGGEIFRVQGPYTPKPKISTGAGDHFNAGFCLGKLLGFDTEMALLTGVTTSGYYVRTAKSPSIADLISMLESELPADSQF
jgi:sugar/nucleoside kinase (ribokinase family)